MRNWVAVACGAALSLAASAGQAAPFGEEKVTFDGVTRVDLTGAPTSVTLEDPVNGFSAYATTHTSGWGIGATSNIGATSGYESGAPGTSETLVLNSWDITIHPFDPLYEAGLVGGDTIVLWQHFAGEIRQNPFAGSSAFANTILSYVDDHGVTQQANTFRSQFDTGPFNQQYDLRMHLSDVPTGPVLHASVFEFLETTARLATDEEMPFSAVDAGHTQAIDGFAVYDANGRYLPGFVFTSSDGLNLPEYNVTPAPEPAAWTLTVVGLALTGGATRSRARRARAGARIVA